MTLLILFSVGIVLAGYLQVLPDLTITLISIILALVCALPFYKKYRLFLWMPALLLGFCYGIYSGHRLIELQLSDDFVDRELIIEGKVIGLPQVDARRQLFTFKVSNVFTAQEMQLLKIPLPKLINLSSYSNLRVKTGEEWRLQVKLKRPRGFVNPKGFDYQASLLRKGIGATGYVRSGENTLLRNAPTFSIDVLRNQLKNWLLEASDSTEKGILLALLIGDTSLVDKEHWDELLKTGTNHLIAISGLHVGFFAIVGYFFGSFFGRCVQLMWHKCPAVVGGYLCSLSFAIFYSLLAGFNIPTIRTLIMLSVVQLALFWRRSFFGGSTLALALVLVLLYDPLAAYDIGFWLSIFAVAVLIFSFSGRISSKHSAGVWSNIKIQLSVFGKSQWVMFIGLLIPLSLLVHTSSLLAPAANFIAIPLITFFVVPCLILAAVIHSLFSFGATLCLDMAEFGIQWFHYWLQLLLAYGDGRANPLININGLSIAIASIGVLLILLPRALGNRSVGLFSIVVSLLVPSGTRPDLSMLVFDVGQGTAVLIRTPRHQLLYDTGPLYTENFDAGSGIIVPYLKGQGINTLDGVVVSHNDQDHSGGLSGLMASTQMERLWFGQLEETKSQLQKSFAQNCHHQQSWEWDGVTFSFLHWDVEEGEAKSNNFSCVLMVEYKGQKILLPGDIEKDVERQLVEKEGLTRVDVLLAPHHGSRTSSTRRFVEKVAPRFVIYSAGFRNQHGHPHPDVRSRYQAVGAREFNTATSGALEFIWRGERMEITEYRHSEQRYWFENSGD